MAQDLLLIRPEAVIQTKSGYYMVDYHKLDIGMVPLSENASLATSEAAALAVALAVQTAWTQAPISVPELVDLPAM